MSEVLKDLVAQREALNQAIAVEEQAVANHAHFHDEDGNVIPDADLNDALLRAVGIAMEARIKQIDWRTMDVETLHNSITVALNAKDYIGAALYAAALNANTTIGG